MYLTYFQIDAFTNRVFSGNPACVVPLDTWLEDKLLLKIAAENAVPETAFLVQNGARYHLRWFTPEIEMDLCGHATLAATHYLKTIKGYSNKTVRFDTLSGLLKVHIENERYTLEFPKREAIAVSLPALLSKSISIAPTKVLKARDYILIYDHEAAVKNISLNLTYFNQLDLETGCVVFTAPGTDCDFVSRVFTPKASILEDPVTGSTHCSLIPYWSSVLGKSKLQAKQLSIRGGILFCESLADSVLIGGSAVTYSKGMLYL